jgi:hypothetical protein
MLQKRRKINREMDSALCKLDNIGRRCVPILKGEGDKGILPSILVKKLTISLTIS